MASDTSFSFCLFITKSIKEPPKPLEKSLNSQCPSTQRTTKLGFDSLLKGDKLAKLEPFCSNKQLFPSGKIQQSNPVQSNYWVEIPSGPKTWRIDSKPGLEVFLCYISLKESNTIKENINKIINDIKVRFSEKTIILDLLQKQLSSIAPINFVRSGKYEHNLTGIVPYKVKTNVYQARNKQSALLLQFIRHK